MPLDKLFDNDPFKRRCAGWEVKYSLWPRRCYYTEKLLWFTLAYRGTSILTGPGEPIFEYRWCNKESYLFLKIKGTI